ncbi:hypothetical protein EAF04_008262 [Stromatinia cepivora]|nr:hypothetical protein EAF04_008262 [Stromatinia cepivora]
MPTYLIEIDLSGNDTLKEKFYKLVENFSNAFPDPECVSRESNSVGFTHEEPLRGTIVIRTRPLTTLLQILSTHLPYFPITPKITQTTEAGIYDPSGYPVQQLLIYVPLHPLHPSHPSHPSHPLHHSHHSKENEEDEADGDGENEEDSSDGAKIQKLQTLFNVISMQLSREGKVSGMRQGEIEGISISSNPSSLETETLETKMEMEMQFKGQECRVWCMWTAWVAEKGKYDGYREDGDKGDRNSKDGDRGEGEERESLAKRVDWGKMEVLGWEERNWLFMSFGEFLGREKEKKRCVVM